MAKAGATATKAVATTDSDDEVEELDDIEETAEASTDEAPKKAKKATPERVGKSTKDVAAMFNITPVRLRRILRAMDQFSDNAYTRYDLTDEQIEAIKAAIASNATASEEKRAAKAKAKAEGAKDGASEDAGEELDDLEDADEAEVEADSDEDEEEEEE
jgi:hypothetical protein